MDPTIRVFAFEDPVDYLNFELRDRQKRDPRYSLRAWSRDVGYKNPSYLSHVLTRKRRLKPAIAVKLADNLALEGKPRRYFELLVLKHNAGASSEARSFGQLVTAARPKKFAKVNQVSLETFAVVSDWYHWAILEMTELAGAELSAREIHRRLAGRIDIRTVRGALERLQRAGLLARDENGKLRRAKPGANKTQAPLPVQAVHAYHRQMGMLAVEAITAQAHEERDLHGTTLAFRKENYQRAREIAKEAHRKILELAERGTGEEIYQFNTQFFRLTGPKSRKVKRSPGSKLTGPAQ